MNCLKCGSAGAYIGLISSECRNSACVDYKKPAALPYEHYERVVAVPMSTGLTGVTPSVAGGYIYVCWVKVSRGLDPRLLEADSRIHYGALVRFNNANCNVVTSCPNLKNAIGVCVFCDRYPSMYEALRQFQRSYP